MNLFRSEEHVKSWSLYDSVSAESIMPLSNWATVFGGPLMRNRLEPDYLSRVGEYAAGLFSSLKKLGKAGPFWAPQQSLKQAVVSDVCRNIRTLYNFEPPATDDEIRGAALQFVRKVSGFNKPSKANETAFMAAVDEVAAVSRNLLRSLSTSAPPRSRAAEAARAHARAAERFSK